MLEIFGGRDWGWFGRKAGRFQGRKAEAKRLVGRKAEAARLEAARPEGFKAGRLKNLVQISGV